MANINLVTAAKVEIVESFEQMTLPAAEAITPGAGVRIDSSGKFTNGNGTSTTENDLYGIATGGRAVAAGEAITAVRRGVLDGFDLSGLAYNAKLYASDTDGRLADAAGTASKVVGRVVPAWSQSLGTAADKLLCVEL